MMPTEILIKDNNNQDFVITSNIKKISYLNKKTTFHACCSSDACMAFRA